MARLVVVSNRLPIAIEERKGRRQLVPAAGGLVSAISPVLQARGGQWIGWLGDHHVQKEIEPLLAECGRRLGYELTPVPLTAEEIAGYYHGFSNEALWPLFHDMVARCNFDPRYWSHYESANRRFAFAIAEHTTASDFLWIHDYHLVLVARELAALGERRSLGFFLHVPFPPADLYMTLPWREPVLDGFLGYGLVGMQTVRDVRNFVGCVHRLRPDASVHGSDERCTISIDGRTVHVGAFPISIDYDDFVHRAVEDRVSEMVAAIRARMPQRQLILGLDRLDYSKGIPDRIAAFDLALERHPELCGRVTLLQVVVPSRTGVGEYQQLKHEIDRLVGQVNGRFTQAGWTPIQYIFRSLSPTELVAYYRVCGVALITPLKDGMNLVAKEYCACSIGDDGVLILSEFAGAAAELSEGALIVNPYDLEMTSEAIFRAVNMDDREKRRRMGRLRAILRERDIFHWVDEFLSAASATKTLDEEASAATGTLGPTLTVLRDGNVA